MQQITLDTGAIFLSCSICRSKSPFKLFADIFRNITNLPKPIQDICNVQFFAWIGWFPFLFYSTTWVAEIYDRTLTEEDSGVIDKVGQATRAGSFAFLVYSLISLSSSFLVPLFVSSSNQRYEESRDSNTFTVKLFKQEYRLSCLKYLKLSFLTLPRAWTISHFIFCACMMSTILVSDVTAAAVVIGLCGISWAISMWAPFSLLGEYISKQEAISQRLGEHTRNEFVHRSHMMASTASLAIGLVGTEPTMYHPVNNNLNQEEDIEMLGVKESRQDVERDNFGESSRSMGENHGLSEEEEQSGTSDRDAPAAGVLLGIHNMYIVLPQFLVTFLSSIIFRLLDNSKDELNEMAPSDTIGLILRIGAVMAGVAGLISMKIGKEV